MTESLRVELNGDGLHAIDAPPSFSAAGEFYVVLENAGQAVHVHLHLDDDLSGVARLDGGNHYVEGGDSQHVHVEASPGPEPVTGKLKIATGYGAETAYIDVRIEPTPESKPGIDVDEELSKPPKREPEPSLADELRAAVPAEVSVPVAALILLVVFVAALVVTLVQNTLVVLSVGLVLGAAAVAALFVLRE